MAKITYSLDQVQMLQDNPNVLRCSPKSVTYRSSFKLWAVKTYYNEGLGPNEIFKQAGFDLAVLGNDKAESSLKRWRKTYKVKGESGLLGESRGRMGGRKPRTKDSSDVEYLNAKVAYLEAENAFLKSLKTKTNN